VKSAATITRRSLFGLAALGLAGCRKGPAPATPHLDPDASALATARALERQLIEATTHPVERALHVQHLAALGGSARTIGADPLTDGASLRSRLRSSASVLRGAAAAAVSGAHASVFASIAASHEVMLHD
jgi:hypothetical protein